MIWPRFGQKTSKNHAFLRSKDILKFHKFINFPWFQHLWLLTLLFWPKKCFVLWKTFSWPTKHQRFQFCPPLCHQMCFGQVLARVLRCNIVKFCRLTRYSSYSGVRTRTRTFSWPSAQKHPRKLPSGPEDVLADGEELLLHEKWPWPSIGQVSRAAEFQFLCKIPLFNVIS